MEMLDGTIIATALPQMAHSFGVGPVALNLGMTAYLLALAAFIPIGGWLANRFGARTVFASAIGLFTFASLLCASSTSLWAFTASRLLQGMAGAAMVPVGRLIVLRMAGKGDLIRAMGTIVWPGLIAPVLGPPLGGLIVEYLSWHWIFIINIPLGIAAVALALAIVPAKLGEPRHRPLDMLGFLLSTAALMLIVFGIDALGNGHQDGGIALAVTLGGLALGALSIRHFMRHPHPLIDLRPLKVRTFAVIVYGGTLQRMAIGAMPLLLPLLFQVGFYADPVTAGGLVLFMFAGNLAMKTVTTPVLKRFGFWRVMTLNGVLAALAIAACATLSPAAPHWLIAVVLFAGGAFRSMQFTSLTAIQFADVPPEQQADANSLSSMMIQLGLGLGVLLGASLLNLSVWLGGRAGEPPMIGDFRFAFVATALVGMLGLIDLWRLPRDAGAALLRRTD
ncbi:hypothetical protein ASE00_15275 [Sphingomonas sp. Root710]|nr:hypothetical protein ASE00_15275 [Sphingomonas sp. Root710]